MRQLSALAVLPSAFPPAAEEALEAIVFPAVLTIPGVTDEGNAAVAVFWVVAILAVLWLWVAALLAGMTLQKDGVASVPGWIPQYVAGLLGNTLYLTIATGLLRFLDCTEQLSEKGLLSLDAAPDTLCWAGDHRWYASWALLLVVAYIVTSNFFGAQFLQVPSSSLGSCSVCFCTREPRAFFLLAGPLRRHAAALARVLLDAGAQPEIGT